MHAWSVVATLACGRDQAGRAVGHDQAGRPTSAEWEGSPARPPAHVHHDRVRPDMSTPRGHPPSHPRGGDAARPERGGFRPRLAINRQLGAKCGQRTPAGAGAQTNHQAGQGRRSDHHTHSQEGWVRLSALTGRKPPKSPQWNRPATRRGMVARWRPKHRSLKRPTTAPGAGLARACHARRPATRRPPRPLPADRHARHPPTATPATRTPPDATPATPRPSLRPPPYPRPPTSRRRRRRPPPARPPRPPASARSRPEPLPPRWRPPPGRRRRRRCAPGRGRGPGRRARTEPLAGRRSCRARRW